MLTRPATPRTATSPNARPSIALYFDEAFDQDERRLLSTTVPPSMECSPVGATPGGFGLVVTTAG